MQTTQMDYLIQHPVIAAIKDAASLEAALFSNVKVCFIVGGKLSDLMDFCSRLKEQGKDVFIHVDMVDGLRPDREGIRFVLERAHPDGIISTKPASIKIAKEYGIAGILRIFLIDSVAFRTGLLAIRSCCPAFVEVMPGLLEDCIRDLSEQTNVPIIASGFITKKAQLMRSLASGAVAISTSKTDLWDL